MNAAEKVVTKIAEIRMKYRIPINIKVSQKIFDEFKTLVSKAVTKTKIWGIPYQIVKRGITIDFKELGEK